MSAHTLIEPLEARIAPALTVLNPLANLFVGPGKTGADIDLSRIFDPGISDRGHTIVTLKVNIDSDLATTGIQDSSIVIELLDDEAPLTVQNFISYLTNYKNTLFHRLISGMRLFGGGFNASTPDTHIPTPFNVHNEFDGVNRSNLQGTIAVEKSDLGPNTGNSEWFFNVADNTSLDSKNGGFTVFARVLQGMDVVNAIAALSTYNFSGATDNKGTASTADDVASIGALGSALTDLPLQNYNPDPDHNPNSPAPKPSADNFVKITSLTVTPPPGGTRSGVTYSVNQAVDIVDATTGMSSNLVTATVTGSKLHLTYKAHAAGAVQVTVHGSGVAFPPGGVALATGDDTFLVNLQPNLVASFAQDPFDGIVIGGDAKTANIVIGNTGGGWAVGNVDIKVYLSRIDGTNGADPNGVLIEPGRDGFIGSFDNQHIDIAGGGTATFTKALQLPRGLFTNGSSNVRVLVEVTPSDAAIAERFADDNISLDSKVHFGVNAFGTFSVPGFGSRTNAHLVYQEADGDVVDLSITAGSARIDSDGSLADLAVVTSTPRSVLTATIVSGAGQGERDIDLHNIELFQYIGAVNMPQASLTGSLSAAAGFRGLNLGDLTGPGQISIGPLPTGVAINPALAFHNVSDFSIESLSRIRAIRAAHWIETDGIPNRIEAVSIGGIEIAGNLEAGISLGALGGLSVGGFLKNAEILTTNNVGLISVGGLDHANIYIGVSARPETVSDFALVRSLGRLAVHGVTGFSSAFIASNVAASRIGSILVTGVAGDSRPDTFGIVADAINSYLRVGGLSSGPRVRPQLFDPLGSYSLKIV